MITLADRIAGLIGAKLAAYDDTLRAGPRGLTLEELAPDHGHDAVAWLVRTGWLIEYTPGHYRAERKETVLGAPDGVANAECGVRSAEWRKPESECGNQEIRKTETENRKPETAVAPRATLRAPSACPQQPKKGQLALFGDLR